MFRQRVVSSLVFAPIVASAFYLGGYYFFFLVISVAALGASEYRRALGSAGIHVGAVMVPLTSLVAVSGLTSDTGVLLASLVAATMVMFVSSLHSGAPSALYGAAGILYIGGLLGSLSVLRGSSFGREWSLLVLFTTWATDVGAYLGGVALGRHKMAPSISPHKSWEGALSGVVASGLTAGLMSSYVGLSLPFSLGIGVALGAVAEAGDLVESLFKRFCGIKDTGNIMPGHGGILDRFDSLLFTGAGGLILYVVHRVVGF